jgi:hypothetical protein
VIRSVKPAIIEGMKFAGDNKNSVTLATSVYMQQFTMRKTTLIAFLSLTVLVSLLTGCGGTKTPPVSERIAKVWTANKIEWDNVTVYTKGATSNPQPGYSNYRLDLSAPPTVSNTEFEGSKFTGQYSVPTETSLVLSNLTPPPTGDNGTIEFTINSISDSELVITRTKTSQKTGNKIVKYTLSNP